METRSERGRERPRLYLLLLVGIVLALGVLEAVTSCVTSRELTVHENLPAPVWLAR